MISKKERAELRTELSNANLGFPLPWRLGAHVVDIVDAHGSGVADCMVENRFTGSSAERYIVAAANATPKTLDALDAADERIAGLEAEAKHWRESALAWAHWAASITGESDQEIPDLTRFVATIKSRIAELEAAAQWRPIEEAPKSETLLVAAPGTCVLRAYWSEGEWRESRVYEPLYFTPTHFRSLPAAPIPALPEGGV